jgi:hypothetical protein
MMRSIREHSIRKNAYERQPPAERDPQAIVRGVFHEEAEKPEYTALYQQIIERATEEASQE